MRAWKNARSRRKEAVRSLTWRLGPLSTVVAAAAMVRVHTYHTSARSYTAVMLWQARTLFKPVFLLLSNAWHSAAAWEMLVNSICTQYMS